MKTHIVSTHWRRLREALPNEYHRKYEALLKSSHNTCFRGKISVHYDCMIEKWSCLERCTRRNNTHRNVGKWTFWWSPNEDSNQPAHPRSLIRVFIVRMMKLHSRPSKNAPSENYDQTARMRRLIWIFTVRARMMCIFLHRGSSISRRYVSATFPPAQPNQCSLCLYTL